MAHSNIEKRQLFPKEFAPRQNGFPFDNVTKKSAISTQSHDFLNGTARDFLKPKNGSGHGFSHQANRKVRFNGK